MSESKGVFLSAEWRDLVMLNYEVEPGLLSRYVPPGTALDSFRGKTYISLVGFRFCHTKLFGRFPIPFHADFDEVNLRFYVRRKAGSEERRGVVFIAEVVPRRAIATTARVLYGENYLCLPMRHKIETNGSGNTVEYQWQVDGQWCRIIVQTADLPKQAPEGSLEQFMTEHYWGYSTQRSGALLEYHVSHEPWNVWTTSSAGFEGEASTLYGRDLGAVLRRRPESAFVADGSPVVVFKGNRLQMRLDDHESETALPREGWILYDGRCGFCFRWVHFWQKVVERRGFAIKDLQSASADGTLQIAEENLLDDVQVLTRSRKLESGANAYLYVSRRIWWAWPFYAVFRLPGFNWMLWRGYHWFNRNRYGISRHCPLPQQSGEARIPKDGRERL